MVIVLLIVAAFFLILSISLRRSADRDEERFVNRPCIITILHKICLRTKSNS